MKKQKKIGVALGGGGARGFCHIGVLQVLEENNVPIYCVSGCSMGSMVGGCYCAGVSLKTLQEVSESINQTVVMDIIPSFKKMGFIKGNRALKAIEPLIGDIKIEDCKIPFRATATEVRNNELKIFSSGSLAQAIRASISIPIAFQAVPLDGGLYVDGGVLERIPIRACYDMGADVVIAIDAFGGAPSKNYEPHNLVDYVERIIMQMDWEKSKDSVHDADLLITPDQGDRSAVWFKDNGASIAAGRKATEEALPQIFSLLK